jgi:hypothetical protein
MKRSTAMKLKLVCAAAALFALPALAQMQSGSGIGARGPSTGTSADTAGAAGTTAPRSGSSETSVGISGATAPPAPTRTSGLCDTLTGDERIRCQREQAATGTQGGGPAGSAGAGSTGMSSGTAR